MYLMSEPQVLCPAEVPLPKKCKYLFQVIPAIQELDPGHATKHSEGDKFTSAQNVD